MEKIMETKKKGKKTGAYRIVMLLKFSSFTATTTPVLISTDSETSEPEDGQNDVEERKASRKGKRKASEDCAYK
jgi:hypothetical protein